MSPDQPFISIILPTYNVAAYVGEAVQSLLSQTFTNFEVLIIDNASTDDTVLRLENFLSDPRVKLYRNESNLGLVYSLNRGLKLATGEFIARMDADDIAAPERLERQLKWLNKNPDYDFCGTWFQYMNRDTVIESPTDYDSALLYALENNPFGHPTMLFKRSALQKLDQPYYLAERYPAEDYDFWLRLLRVCRGANLPEILLSYRIHEHQISNQNVAQLEQSDRIREEHLTWLFPLLGVTPRSVRKKFIAIARGRRPGRKGRIAARCLSALAVASSMLFHRVTPKKTALYFRNKNL